MDNEEGALGGITKSTFRENHEGISGDIPEGTDVETPRKVPGEVPEKVPGSIREGTHEEIPRRVSRSPQRELLHASYFRVCRVPSPNTMLVTGETKTVLHMLQFWMFREIKLV